jgi:hypothetical protein
MVKKIHIKSQMFLPAPYVVRVDHKHHNSYELDLTEFYKLLRRTRTTILATWGYSDPELEVASTEIDEKSSKAWNQLLNIIDTTTSLRSYWVFTDEVDALQFRLGLPEVATQVFMWPYKKVFTIYEYD